MENTLIMPSARIDSVSDYKFFYEHIKTAILQMRKNVSQNNEFSRYIGFC